MFQRPIVNQRKPMLKLVRLSLLHRSTVQICKHTCFQQSNKLMIRGFASSAPTTRDVAKPKTNRLQLLDKLYQSKDVQSFRRVLEELSQIQSFKRSSDKFLHYFSKDFIDILKPNTACNLLASMCNLGIDCSNRNQRELVVKLLDRTLVVDDEPLSQRNLNDLLLGLAMCKFRAVYVDKKKIETLGICIEEASTTFGSKQFCNVLLNLSKIGVQWQDFNVDTLKALNKTLVEKSTTLSVREAAMMFNALGKLGYDYPKAVARMQQCLGFLAQDVFLKCIEEKTNPFTPNNMCSTLVGLAQMGVKFSDFEPKQQQTILKLIYKVLPDCNEVGIANFVHS